jgi:hypothetical protein
MYRVACIDEGNEIRKFLKFVEDFLEIQGEYFFGFPLIPVPLHSILFSSFLPESDQRFVKALKSKEENNSFSFTGRVSTLNKFINALS